MGVCAPLKLVKCDTTLDIIAFVKGGGLTGQSEAIQLGVSRQLCKIDEKHRITLKPLGFLTRDSRNKERKKYGLRKARKAPQYSKRQNFIKKTLCRKQMYILHGLQIHLFYVMENH